MSKKALVLGAGLVARPLVRHLLSSGVHVTLTDLDLSRARSLVEGSPNGRVVAADLGSQQELDGLVEDSDLVVSLLPYTLHAQVARRCVAVGRPLVTTSYVSNEMRELSAPAREKGVLLLNELGLDPGIDHMSAMRVIDRFRDEGDFVTRFRSCCGGLPAPDANDNPWGYKFSWSPRGVLLAGRNSARFLDRGAVRDVDARDLFATVWDARVDRVGPLEMYPNRDSLQYIGIYSLDRVESMMRGTFRYPGWCRMMKALVDMGWLSLDKPPAGAGTLGQVTAALTRAPKGLASEADLAAHVASRLGMDPGDDALARIRWAGLFGAQALDPHAETVLDVLAAPLKERLSYKPGERDMVVLVHEFEAASASGARRKATSTLLDFGVPDGDSAMARTVSLPAAIAAVLVLEGRIDLAGVQIPVDRRIYEPVLARLESVGIHCRETWE
jgi:saccharopine dehydrogenase-like NADP-dependent oxidoreductase